MSVEEICSMLINEPYGVDTDMDIWRSYKTCSMWTAD